MEKEYFDIEEIIRSSLESQKKSNENNKKIINNKYYRYEKLGYGSFGTVYRAEGVEDGKAYSLKKFYFDRNKDMLFTQNQFDLIHKLDHLNITKIIEIFKYNENVYFSMDYHEYNLLDLITKKQVTNPNMIRSICYQFIQGVAYLHSQNILHRDLKPENIMLNSQGIIKIIDFDLAKHYYEDINLTKGVATLYYKPAEILFGDTKYGKALDLWCIGCILAEILLLEPLFKANNELGVLSKIVDLLGAPDVF